MTRILVIEDERDIADFIRRGLIFKGYEVEVAFDGDQGLTLAHEWSPDMVLLDLMLPWDRRPRGVPTPAGGGRPTCHCSYCPLISVVDKVQGLDAGADDYITKPFAFEELLARIRAALRRRAPGGEVITVGDVTIRPEGREVERGGRAIELTARESTCSNC